MGTIYFDVVYKFRGTEIVVSHEDAACFLSLSPNTTITSIHNQYPALLSKDEYCHLRSKRNVTKFYYVNVTPVSITYYCRPAHYRGYGYANTKAEITQFLRDVETVLFPGVEIVPYFGENGKYRHIEATCPAYLPADYILVALATVRGLEEHAAAVTTYNQLLKDFEVDSNNPEDDIMKFLSFILTSRIVFDRGAGYYHSGVMPNCGHYMLHPSQPISAHTLVQHATLQSRLRTFKPLSETLYSFGEYSYGQILCPVPQRELNMLPPYKKLSFRDVFAFVKQIASELPRGLHKYALQKKLSQISSKPRKEK